MSVPALKTKVGRGGGGLAVCPTLGLLVTSSHSGNTLSVFALSSSGAGASADAGAGAGLARVCTLGGAGSPAPMRFKFWDHQWDGGFSAWMAFTGPAISRLLLVTDAGHDAVHVIDVVSQVHVGYVAAPGAIDGPRGVAARGSLVAVSAWRGGSGEHVVRVFEGSGASWSAVRVVGGGFGGPGSADGQLKSPHGLRFSADGTGLAVADWHNGRVSLFLVQDGSFARHVATGLCHPRDLEQSEGGWLVVCTLAHTIMFVDGDVDGGGDGARLGRPGTGDGNLLLPSAVALVPGLGMVVQDNGEGGRVQFFATPDAIAMASMSAVRVGWMVAVARGAGHRALIAARHPQLAGRPGPTGKRRRQGQRGSAV